jgi:formylglycine-generating enzyme required for sulfatase activity
MTVTANFEFERFDIELGEIEMVFVQGGTFFMGCTPEQGTACAANESPAHEVTLSSFSIGKYPVTQAQWAAVMGDNPSSFTGDLSRPVERISWNDIVNAFIPNLNEMTGMTYRLPTEAEREFAARGGTNTRWHIYSGSDDINEVACFNRGGLLGTCPVGTKAPNELGIYDMSGNVLEWVHDWHGNYTAEAKTNPTGPSSGSNRVIRGGCWNCPATTCRVSNRSNTGTPGFRGINVGFRLAVSP